MYYAGYYTLKAYNHETTLITLSAPNESILSDVINGILKSLHITSEEFGTVIVMARDLVSTIFNGNNDEGARKKVQEHFNAALAKVAWQLLKTSPHVESTYNAYLSLWLRVGCTQEYEYLGNEISTNTGDMELAIRCARTQTVCIVEYKFDKSTSVALKQIKEKRFKDSFPGFRVICLGINITKDRRAEVGVIWDLKEDDRTA
jgi:hypothetical protein